MALDRGPLLAHVRDDATGEWVETQIAPEADRPFVRAFGMNHDPVTNVHFVLAGTGAGEIYAGGYDPNQPGGIRWQPIPEYRNPDFDGGSFKRCRGFCVANDKADASVSPRLLERRDGPGPEWVEVFRWYPEEHAGAGFRGTTAVPALDGEHQVILGSREQEGRILRIDPFDDYAVELELESHLFLEEQWGGRRAGKLVAYNRFVPGTHPRTGEPIHWVTMAAMRPGDEAAAWLMLRHHDADYELIRVADPKLEPHPTLISTRTLEAAPWNQREIYTGGYDGAANNRSNHNTAWIFRGVVADPEAVTMTRDIPYGQMETVGPLRLNLDIYQPDGAGGAPIMRHLHGGGWQRGDKRAVARKPELLCGMGWVLASANYRFVPEVTPADQVRDIADAIAWLREQAAEYGGDPERIFLSGHSAGAHLVALVSTDLEPMQEVGLALSTLSGTIVIDTGTLDLVSHIEVAGQQSIFANAFGDDPESWREVSPLAHVAPGAGIPPFLLLIQGNETRLAGAQCFADAVVVAGSQAEVVYLPQHSHASINQSIGDPGDPTTEAVLGFLEQAERKR